MPRADRQPPPPHADEELDPPALNEVRLGGRLAAEPVAVVLPSPDGPWPLSVELSESDGVTTLVFVHRLAEPYDASSIGPGWHYYLDRLDAAVHGAPMPEGEDWPDYELLGPEYPLPAS